MPRAFIDQSVQRRTDPNGFTWPLGVYPLEETVAKTGYITEFEAADGSEPFLSNPELFEPGGYESNEWEEWPDRILYDIQVSAERLPGLLRMMLPLLPGRIFPILDVIGADAYREIDPWIAFEPVGVERIYDGVRYYGDWLLEDGMVGFGALSLEPFVYFFVDEHKILTVRVELELKERVDRILGAFDLKEIQDLGGVSEANHEHRSVLAVPKDSPEAADYDGIMLHLRDLWLLQLNINPATNLDDEGRDVGITAWQCLTRCREDEGSDWRYAEVLLTADCLEHAERLAADAVAAKAEGSTWAEVGVPFSNRLSPEDFARALGSPVEEVFTTSSVRKIVWPKDPAESRGPDDAAEEDGDTSEGEGDSAGGEPDAA